MALPKRDGSSETDDQRRDREDFENQLADDLGPALSVSRLFDSVSKFPEKGSCHLARFLIGNLRVVLVHGVVLGFGLVFRVHRLGLKGLARCVRKHIVQGLPATSQGSQSRL